jgi:hypothetical protein
MTFTAIQVGNSCIVRSHLPYLFCGTNMTLEFNYAVAATAMKLTKLKNINFPSGTAYFLFYHKEDNVLKTGSEML